VGGRAILVAAIAVVQSFAVRARAVKDDGLQREGPDLSAA